MVISGLTGELRWSYLTAASFGPWRCITEQDGTARLTCRVVSVDAFRVTQAPLIAVLQIGKWQHRRKVIDLQIVGDSLNANLSELEK